jgi:hypothetical protein
MEGDPMPKTEEAAAVQEAAAAVEQSISTEMTQAVVDTAGNRLVSMGEVARQLRVPTATVRGWEIVGLIRATMRGGLKCVTVGEMNRFLEGSFGYLHSKRVQ